MSAEGVMRVLVAAASRHGASTGVAEAIGRTLASAGLESQVIEADAVASIDGFDAIVLGSAVYYGQWLPAAIDFVRRHEPALKTRLVWLFSVGPIGSPEPKPAEDPHIVSELMDRIRAREHRLFAGALLPEHLGLGEKLTVSIMGAPEGDFRDWQAIRAWAEEIADAIARDRPARGRSGA